MRIHFDIICFGGGENGVGQKIKDIAKEEGLSLKEVARRAGIPYTTLYSMVKRDSDNSNMETLLHIADALCVHISELYGFESGSKEKLATDNFEAGYYLGSEATINHMLKSGYNFTGNEMSLIELYRKLNDEGCEKALERVEELTEIPKYQKKEPDGN